MSTDHKKIANDLDKVCAERDLGGFYSMIFPWMKSLETLGKHTHIKDAPLRKTSLTLAEMQSLAFEFYDDLGFDFEEKISRIIMDEKTIFRTSESSDKGGFLAVGLHSQKDGSVAVEVDLHPKSNIYAVVTIAHEFGHMLGQRIQQKVVPKTDCLGEVESMFIEQIFTDWLFEKGQITEKEKEIFRQHRENNLASEIYKILDEKQIIENLGTPISAQKLQEFDEKLTKSGNVRDKEHYERVIQNMISNPDSTGEYMFRYVFGEIVASAMYEDYQTEPQQTLQRLSRYFEHSEEYDFGMRKTWQDGRCRTSDQINNEEMKRFFTDLLGDNYEEKLSKVINPQTTQTANQKFSK